MSDFSIFKINFMQIHSESQSNNTHLSRKQWVEVHDFSWHDAF